MYENVVDYYVGTKKLLSCTIPSGEQMKDKKNKNGYESNSFPFSIT